MLILTNFTIQGSLTSVTTPPRTYSEKAVVSQMLKEYGPGDRVEKWNTVRRSQILITTLNSLGSSLETLKCWVARGGLECCHTPTVCFKSEQLGKETVTKQSNQGRETLTTDFDLDRADAVELRHALDSREDTFGAIWKSMTLVIYAEHDSGIILKKHNNLQLNKKYFSNNV